MLVFDIETDGLLDTLTKVHCINLVDRSTNKLYSFNHGVYADGSPAPRDGSIEDGLAMLEAADCLAGHKVIGFDIPALKKIYPRWFPRGVVFDSLVCSNVIWTNLMDLDLRATGRGSLPDVFRTNGLIGRHSLEAWGYRLGEYKGDFDGGENGEKWKDFTPEMDEYARQDPIVTLKLIEKIESKGYARECIELEHNVQRIIFRQQERGWAFSVPRAEALTAKLQRRHAELTDQLTKAFDPWYTPDVKKGSALFTPKGDNKKMGYTKGAALSKVKLVVFNPGSRDHIADRLKKLRGWVPTEFTDGGKPKVDETTLEGLTWPEAKLCCEYLLVEKRLGQVANGDKAWLKFATTKGIYGIERDGVVRIHGGLNTNGAVTGRMTHSNPNVSQTPAVGVPYGIDARACWVVTPGLVLVGCDAEGIELRMLGHYMARFDGGAYANAVANGDKSKGTDVHTLNKVAIGLNKRDSAKTFIYALCYGAGAQKLGTIVYEDFTDEQRSAFLTKYPTMKKRMGALKSLGAKRKARLMENLPALRELTEAVQAAVKARGFLKGLDGRILHVRAEHSALNTLLQSGGAVVMKKALTFLDEGLDATFRCNSGVVAEPVGNIHDEFQIETNKEIADDVGKFAADCIVRAGQFYNLRCPLAGSFSVGTDWAGTH